MSESNSPDMTQDLLKKTKPDEVTTGLVLRVFRVANLLAEAQTPVVPRYINHNHTESPDKKHKDTIV